MADNPAVIADLMHSCVKKVRHDTMEAATAAAIARTGQGLKIDAYKCRHCAGFHIGHARRAPTREAQSG